MKNRPLRGWGGGKLKEDQNHEPTFMCTIILKYNFTFAKIFVRQKDPIESERGEL